MSVRADIIRSIIAKEKKKKKKRLNPPPPLARVTVAINKTSTISKTSTPPAEVGPAEKKIPIFSEANFSAYSPQEQEFLATYLQTGSSTLAAKKAYKCNSTLAATLGFRMLAKMQIPLTALLDAKEVSLGSLVKVVKDAQHATKYVKVDKFGEMEKVPDHTIRLRSAEVVGKWMGIAPVQQTNTNVQINNIIGEAKKKYDI